MSEFTLELRTVAAPWGETTITSTTWEAVFTVDNFKVAHQFVLAAPNCTLADAEAHAAAVLVEVEAILLNPPDEEE